MNNLKQKIDYFKTNNSFEQKNAEGRVREKLERVIELAQRNIRNIDNGHIQDFGDNIVSAATDVVRLTAELRSCQAQSELVAFLLGKDEGPRDCRECDGTAMVGNKDCLSCEGTGQAR